MFKKLISYLVIFSILFVDGASCMQDGDSEDKRPLLQRRLSLDDSQVNFQPHLPSGKEEELLRLQGNNAEEGDAQAPQPLVPVSLPSLLEKEQSPVPPPISLAEGNGEEARPPRSPAVIEENVEDEENNGSVNVQAPQPPVPVNPSPLPEKVKDPFPSQENREPPALPPSESDGEEATPQAPLLNAEENREDEEEISPNVPLSSDEEDEDGFVFLPDHGSRLRLNQLEGEPLVEDPLMEESLSQKYLQLLRINPQDLTPEEIEDLETILRIEGTWKNHLIWANLAAVIHKTLFALTTNKHAINKRKQQASCDPLWLHGGPIPLDSSSAIKRNIILKTLGSSLEEGIIESLHTALLALMGYQLYKVVDSGEFSWNLAFFANFYKEADAVSYLGIIKRLHDSPALFALLASPFVFAVAKTLYTYLQISEPTDTAVDETVKSLRNRSRKWDSVIFNITSTIFDITSNILSITPFLSSLLHLHPLKRTLPALTSLILWEGRLPPEAREKAFTAILESARTRKGFSKMTAIESLYHLAHGMNIRNLIQRPHDVEDLLHIKLQAFHALKEIYKELPIFSLNKFRTAALLWEIGQSPSWFISIIEPIKKALRAALYAYTIYGIFDVLYKYFTCPYEYLENFTWVGGLEPYASDYSKECFDAQVAAFNTLPGQPASTLIGNLDRYHFPGPYDLDLSNKGIEGPVIADIVEGFQRANVPLRSLNASYNFITNSSNIARVFAALPPEIIQLDFSNNDVLYGFSSDSSRDFLGLGRLTGLQIFNISNNKLQPGDIGIIGQALQNLSYLKEIRLAGNVYNNDNYLNTNITQIAHSLKPSLTLLDLTVFDLSSDLGGQIALGNSLAKITTLEQLYLGDTGIGGYIQTNTTLSKAALNALAQGLFAQQNLHVLNLSGNWLGYYADMNGAVSFLLSSLPSSLTHLDVSYNNIGSYNSSEVKALAQAVQQMSGLTSFQAGGKKDVINNMLGNSPDFLKALKGKKNLTFLDLSLNSCNDPTLIRDLLQTTPNLETLDLSDNQLSNGSMLVPVLSALQKLKSLNLDGNKFTTADRVSIWKATSYLPKSPFYLDQDLNYTSTYLKSFPSTTTHLNLSGLIPKDPTALETIMPQIVSLFPNLRKLDLSNNNIYGVDSNLTPIIGGIQALNTYLPKLTHLQFLKMSTACCYPANIAPPADGIRFSQIIGRLPNLQVLDFSNIYFLIANSLGMGLEKIHSLTSINLAGCWPDPLDISQGGVQLMQGLQAQLNLTHLDLSNNLIGSSYNNSNPWVFTKDPNSTLALAKALNSWPQLKSFNLAFNLIGYEDPKGASTFLEKLADLAATINKQGRTLEVNLLNGISNVEWTQGAQVLETLTQQKIKDACARQLCTGDPISKPTPSEAQARDLQRASIAETNLPAATSDASSSHQVPWYSPAKLVTAWKSWWERPIKAIDITNPHIEELVRFKEKCDRMIKKADIRTADPWYRFSLEDLREEVKEMVKYPAEVNEDTIKHFYRRLDGIEWDFLRKPLSKKPSFIAASKPLTTSLTGSNNVVELWPVLTPLLWIDPVPLALGRP